MTIPARTTRTFFRPRKCSLPEGEHSMEYAEVKPRHDGTGWSVLFGGCGCRESILLPVRPKKGRMNDKKDGAGGIT